MRETRNVSYSLRHSYTRGHSSRTSFKGSTVQNNWFSKSTIIQRKQVTLTFSLKIQLPSSRLCIYKELTFCSTELEQNIR